MGLDDNFDEANITVTKIKNKLDMYLDHIRELLNNKKINFSHAKYRYELEVPEDLVKGNKKPKDFEFTSQRKGYERFHTPVIKKLVDQLEDAEETLKEAMVPFLCAIFSRFHEQKDVWTRAINVLTEVDCLASLAIASGQ